MVAKNADKLSQNKAHGRSMNFLVRYHKEGDEFLNHIVTGGETWIFHVTPVNKEQSIQWRHSASPKENKFKQTLSARKIMGTVFWDRRSVLLLDFMTQGKTINADVYCEPVSKLRRAIHNKRRGLLSSGVLLFHDNTRPHTAARTRQLLEQLQAKVFENPPYRPDLAPNDSNLFPHLKGFLAAERFSSDDEVKTAVQHWVKTLAADFFDEGIQNLCPDMTNVSILVEIMSRSS
jgi:transposase